MSIDERFNRIDASIQTLTQYIQDFRKETIDRLEVIEHRLEILSSTVCNIDARFPALTKAVLDFGTLSSRLVREQSRQQENTADILARIAKLEETVAGLHKPAA